MCFLNSGVLYLEVPVMEFLQQNLQFSLAHFHHFQNKYIILHHKSENTFKLQRNTDLLINGFFSFYTFIKLEYDVISPLQSRVSSRICINCLNFSFY